MGWLADILQEIPVSATLKVKLEKVQADFDKLTDEAQQLKDTNAWLEAELTRLKGAGISDIEVKLLVILSNARGRTLAEHLAPQLKISTIKAQHYLTKLDDAHYVQGHLNAHDGHRRYALADKGREYLVVNNLVD
jgi:hypothetical protein